MRLATRLMLLALILTAASVSAGTIHPKLEAVLADTPSGEQLSVIVHMQDQAPIASLNQELKVQRATLQQRHRDVVLALKSVTGSQDALKLHLDNAMITGDVAGYKSYWISNMIVVMATREEVLRIADRMDVDVVEPNFTVELVTPVEPFEMSTVPTELGTRGIGVTPGLRAINADDVWYQLGFTGAGRLIASCDTGVMGSHPALTDRWRGNNHPASECWLDNLGSSTYPSDGHGHGTHTTGTMTGVAFDDTVGVAWEAEWIACNAIDQGVGSGFDNDIIDTYEWLADPDNDPFTNDDVPDVVQNSWRINEGFGGDYTDCDDRWWVVIDNCEAAGCVSVWSAGNEGSGSTTIGSPADRATTEFNALSVGAVDATNYGWPYPIAGFSSRGPTGCDVDPDLKIKPEVVGPGVDVYSSTNNGGYAGGWSGTSMSGPHVAGIVALIRQANPNLDVDTIKQILMETSRDEGSTGEDNIYGHGFVDAYAAVIASTVGFGTVEGTVTNASWGNSPIAGAHVELLSSGYNWNTAADGSYAGSAAADLYTIRASAPGFAAQERLVEVISDETSVEDFQLIDIAGPVIENVSQPGATSDTVGPYTISAEINDFSTVASANLYYRVNNTAWIGMAMTGMFGDYSATIPGQLANSQVDFYIWAEDGGGLSSVAPTGAPGFYYTFYVTDEAYAYDAESADTGWQLGVTGDAATSGVWERVDPEATEYDGETIQPEDDHTVAPGVMCFVTDGTAGTGPGDFDVDGGCTTLVSPTFDLSAADMAFVTYWRWFGQAGFTTDDEFAVDVSDDGGSTWTAVERVPGMENSWTRVVGDLNALIDLTDQVVFRFVACDEGGGGLVEAAIDDFTIETFNADATGAPGGPFGPSVRLYQNQPNPFSPEDGMTTIRFSLDKDSSAQLRVYDISGRLVRKLAEGSFPAGEHQVNWNGKNERGESVSSGVYFYRLQAGAFVESSSLTILH